MDDNQGIEERLLTIIENIPIEDAHKLKNDDGYVNIKGFGIIHIDNWIYVEENKRKKVDSEELDKKTDAIINSLLKYKTDEWDMNISYSDREIIQALAFSIKKIELALSKQPSPSWPSTGHDSGHNHNIHVDRY